MGQTRFEEIKRWFHLSPPQTLARRRFFNKLEPLSSHLQERFQNYVVPATQISIDEMMVRFTGRSHHTLRMPNKPIPEGYKIYALCEHGYTYAWAYYSRIDSFLGFDKRFPGPHPDGPNQPLELTPTSRMFFWLCMTLPWKWRRFEVFCDNYFSNVPLFRALLMYGITCCGTVRPNSSGYPKALKQVEKKKNNLEWGTMAGEIVNGVLATIWQDKTLVRFLTTAYDMSAHLANFVEVWRRRPRLSKGDNAYRQFIESVWGDNARQLQSQPKAAVDYNLYMGGVDMADQR
jgi:hypothetical protein